jgi:hypothetical protein
MCIDYRMLNKSVVMERFPVPRVSYYLENAARHRYFSLIDLKDGYHQLRLAKEAQALTAFSTDFGHYQFTTLPFGLSIAPMAFQRAMESIFPKSIYPWVQIYLDDILIMADTLTTAKQRLRTVLTILRHHQIKANLAKSQLLRTRIHYLGHTVQQHTLTMESDKVGSFLRRPYPTTVTELRSFLGVANYYREFIPNFAAIATPLYPLTGKREMPPPTHDQLSAYHKIRDLVRRLPTRFEQTERSTVQLKLFSDACENGIGAVLETKEGKPIGYYSRKLSTAESNMGIYEKEMLALVSAAEYWRHRLIGAPAVYHVDNRALSLAQANRMENPRVARWLTRLAVFGLEFQLLKSEENIVADYLSRYMWDIDDEYKLPFVLSGGG